MDKSALPLNQHGTKQGQLYLLLRSAIVNGHYPYGSKLPGELKLAQIHNVSRVTVRAAIQALQDASLVKRKAGLGTVVIFKQVKANVIRASVSELLPKVKKMGSETQIKLLEFQYETPSDHVAEQLKISGKDQVQRSVRVRSREGCPFSYLVTYVNADFANKYDEADLASTPLYELLERAGVSIESASETISATLAEVNVAAALDVPVGSPLIALTRSVYNKDGEGIEYLEALYRPDQYQLQIELERVGEQHERRWQSM